MTRHSHRKSLRSRRGHPHLTLAIMDGPSMMDSAAVQRQHWDVIIIGTGVGGATVGRSLAAQRPERLVS